MYERILVPLDGSDTSRGGLREAIALAKTHRSTLRLLHVVSEYPAMMEMADAKTFERVHRSLFETGEALLKEAKALAEEFGVAAEMQIADLQGGRVADVIVQEAREAGCDLIVIGTHGRHGLARALLGSDAERVLRQSPVPVLLVRETRKEA